MLEILEHLLYLHKYLADLFLCPEFSYSLDIEKISIFLRFLLSVHWFCILALVQCSCFIKQMFGVH